jgi:hypothetical protein
MDEPTHVDLISKYTRSAFSDQLVADWTMRTIGDLFDGADIPRIAQDDGQPVIGSVRRALISDYYRGVDWSSVSDVRKVLLVYEQVLAQMATDSVAYKKLANLLKRDGFVYRDGRITSKIGLDLEPIKALSESINVSSIRDHIRRIEQSVDSDPAQAIGSAKELVETVSKVVLQHFGQPSEGYDTVQRLAKEALKCLPFTKDPASETRAVASLKQVTSGLGQIVGGVAELRNAEGTGHGRIATGNLESRHARLAVTAASALCTFMLESLEAHRPLGTATVS